jgi:hypothetical protein
MLGFERSQRDTRTLSLFVRCDDDDAHRGRHPKNRTTMQQQRGWPFQSPGLYSKQMNDAAGSCHCELGGYKFTLDNGRLQPGGRGWRRRPSLATTTSSQSRGRAEATARSFKRNTPVHKAIRPAAPAGETISGRASWNATDVARQMK